MKIPFTKTEVGKAIKSLKNIVLQQTQHIRRWTPTGSGTFVIIYKTDQ
jgi:penicillin-binding protein-related factor A (putative recombinase)